MKSERFKVLAVESNGSVQLANLDMQKRGVRNFTVWAMTETPLKRGQVVFGGFDFDPSESLFMGKFPTLEPVMDDGRPRSESRNAVERERHGLSIGLSAPAGQ